MSEFQPNDAVLTMSLEESAVGSLANNLTTETEGFALDARQGKVLDDKKLDVSKVANNLTTITEGWALDARQGKWLNETKVGFGDIANDLNTDDVNKVLSAAQAKVLNDSIDTLKTGLPSFPLSVANGGTGATDAPTARKNLGAVNMQTRSVTLTSSGWGSDSNSRLVQNVSVSDLKSTDSVIVTPEASSVYEYNTRRVVCYSQADGTLGFWAQASQPTTSLTVNIMILREG